MEDIINNILDTLGVQSKRIDLANERIDGLKELVEEQGKLLLLLSKKH